MPTTTTVLRRRTMPLRPLDGLDVADNFNGIIDAHAAEQIQHGLQPGRRP
ncbi:MAG: hypothetical protein R2911_39665 [Caldilineaceae bacterium]